MKKIIVLLFVVFCFTDVVCSQTWQQYSDSVIVSFKKNNVDKAVRFIELADNEINKKHPIKDTIYADYIYRKGVVQSSLGDFSSILLKEALGIWELSDYENFLKIMKINYFLGVNYFLQGNKSQNKEDYLSSYNYYDTCYSLIKKYKFQNQSNFKGVLFALSFIDYAHKEDFKKAKKYAEEYVDFSKKIGLEDFDFSYSQVLKFKQDILGQEKLLLEYLEKYEKNRFNNPALKFKIYFELFVNKQSFLINGLYQKYPQEVIKYGEKAIDICKSNNLKADSELGVIYLQLENTYSQIKDNIKAEKYRKLNYENRSNSNELDYFDVLDKLYFERDYENFELKFNEYEDVFKRDEKYADLIEIYRYSLNLYGKGLLFTKQDIKEQLMFVENKSRLLTEETIAILDLCLAEFYTVSGKYNIALTYCNRHLNDVSVNRKINFYLFKSISESYLGYKKHAFNTLQKTLIIAKEAFGDNDPRLLRIYNYLIVQSNNNDRIKLTSEVLKIIYDNDLEEAEIGARTWNSLADSNLLNHNYSDAEFYYEKAKFIFKNPHLPFNPYGYIESLQGLSRAQRVQGKYHKAQENLAEAKLTLDGNPQINKIFYGDYYSLLGDLYFFQNEFSLASENYRNSFSYYDDEFSPGQSLYFTISEYLLDNNIPKALDGIERFQKVNSEFVGAYWSKYLLIYQTGDLQAAKKALMELVDKQISKNREYFQLLSSDEREAAYKNFIKLFEYLNGYLVGADQLFLNNYIDYRFYSKSLLLSDSINKSNVYEDELVLFEEFNVNTLQINKVIESSEVNNVKVDSLTRRNREIEKFLSVNNNTLEVPTLKDVNKKLNLEAAYVEIIRINKQARDFNKKFKDNFKFFSDSISYGAIIIKKNTKPKFVLIDSTNRLENEFVPLFKSKLINKKQDTDSYHVLFEPIEKELQGIKNIYFVTDGAYNAINIESIYNPAKKQSIIDYLNIQQIQNIRSLIDQKTEFKISESTKVSLFGNPDFNLKIENKNQTENLLVNTEERSVISEIKTSIKISPLKGTQIEIDNINTMLKKTNCSIKTFSDSLASEDNLKHIDSPDILHIATHGYFLKDDENSKTKRSISNLINDDFKGNSYLKSGLLLAGAQNTLNNIDFIGVNNGIINGEEVKSLNLHNTELVVLSACETGLGDNLVGQGVVGLQRAFMIAGAKSVIMSLWSVSDEKTQQLMTLFYTNMIKNQMSKENALRQAKLEIKKMYPQPYYWAGFVLLE